MVSRRRFLLVGLGVGTAVTAAPAGASVPGTVTLWKLSADWGYPAGPKGRTRCKGRACHLHAANKVYATHDAAIAGRTHMCCVSQPYPIEVSADTYRALTALPSGGHGTDLADLRRPHVADILARGSSTAVEQSPTSPSHSGDGPAAPGPDGVSAPASGRRPPAELAATGVSSLALVGGAAAVGTVGATMLAVARRNAVADEPTPTTSGSTD